MAELNQHIVQPHDAHADLARLQRHFLDLGNRKTVAVDDVVQKDGGGSDGLLEALVIDGAVVDEAGQIDGAEIAAFIGQQPLLAAGIGGLEACPGAGSDCPCWRCRRTAHRVHR